MSALLRIIVFAMVVAMMASSAVFAAEMGEGAYKEMPRSEHEAFMKRMSATLKLVKSLKADFTQERHLSVFLDVLRAKGTFYFEMPDRLRWELREPYASVLVFNSGHAAKFNMQGKRLVKMKLGMEDLLQEVLKQIISIMHGDFDRIRGVYGFSLSRGKDIRLTMSPLSAGVSKMIKSIELSIDPVSYHVTKITIREPRGDYIEIGFYGEEENSGMDERIFDLNDPRLPAGLKAAENG